MEGDAAWNPIEAGDFYRLLREEEDELSDQARDVYHRFHTINDRALILRSKMYGEEHVFVVARSPDGVIYYDDVEDGFDFSPVDEHGRITRPGAANRSLAEAVEKFLVPTLKKIN